MHVIVLFCFCFLGFGEGGGFGWWEDCDTLLVGRGRVKGVFAT